jgi:hypothetical protein
MNKLKTPLNAECESMDRDVRTVEGLYLSTAPTDKHAKLWAKSPVLLKLIKKLAEGTPVLKEEAERALDGIEE